MAREPLDPDQQAAFRENGYLVLRGFYDLERDIAPIQEGIRRIVELVASKQGIEAPCGTAREAMTDGYMALIAADRGRGGVVYDAVKQLPGFLALVADPANRALFEMLRPGSDPGIAAGGYGIRIDNPSEDLYRALWHQEFPAQLRSRDGVVFWAPLIPVSENLGPVQIASGSHRGGPIPVYEDDGGIGKSGAYSLRLENEAAVLARYPVVAPTTEPGDLVLMDFLTVHQSGRNVADYPRWSMQFRYFNFRDPLGIDIDWAGSYRAGTRFEDIIPDLKVSRS